jgi:hypothetical protein
MLRLNLRKVLVQFSLDLKLALLLLTQLAWILSDHGRGVNKVHSTSLYLTLLYLLCLMQEREEAEALWAVDGQSLTKGGEVKEEGREGTAAPARSGRSGSQSSRSRGRGRVTGGKDEL